MKAEEHFKEVAVASRDSKKIRIHIHDEYYLASDLWGTDSRRYTGIHIFHAFGSVKVNSGVNLTEGEWGMLVENFDCVKKLLQGEKVDLKECRRSPTYDDSVTVYTAQWYVDDKPYSSEVPVVYFSEEDAAIAAADNKPSDVDAIMRVQEQRSRPPSPMLLMNHVFLQIIREKIQEEAKRNCEACKIDSPSQKNHCLSGNCMDDLLDFIQIHFHIAKFQVQVFELMQLFDQVRCELRMKPMYSQQLAQCAMAYIADDVLLKQLYNKDAIEMSPLMSVVAASYHQIF